MTGRLWRHHIYSTKRLPVSVLGWTHLAVGFFLIIDAFRANWTTLASTGLWVTLKNIDIRTCWKKRWSCPLTCHRRAATKLYSSRHSHAFKGTLHCSKCARDISSCTSVWSYSKTTIFLVSLFSVQQKQYHRMPERGELHKDFFVNLPAWL